MATKGATLEDIVALITDPARQQQEKSGILRKMKDRLSTEITLPGPVQCERAAEYLNRKYSDAAQAQAFSAPLSDDVGGKSEAVKIRRAYALLYAMISSDVQHSKALNNLPAGRVKDIDGKAARDNLKRLVRIAATLQDCETNKSDVSGEVLRELCQNPEAFLEETVVDVKGPGAQSASEFSLGVNDVQNPRRVSFGYDVSQGRYEFGVIRDEAANLPNGYMAVTADFVNMEMWRGITGVLVPGNDAGGDFSKLRGTQLGADIMVTPRLSGCAFAMKRLKGKVYCAHIQPAPKGQPLDEGKALAEAIVSGKKGVRGDFCNAKGGKDLAVYGRQYSHGTKGKGYDKASNAIVLGFRHADGDFHIYSQEVQNYEVHNAQRIF